MAVRATPVYGLEVSLRILVLTRTEAALSAKQLVIENLVQKDSEFARPHTRIMGAILAPENGIHPPAALLHRVGKEHRCFASAEQGHELIGSAVGQHKFAENKVERTSLEQLYGLFAGCCVAKEASVSS